MLGFSIYCDSQLQLKHSTITLQMYFVQKSSIVILTLVAESLILISFCSSTTSSTWSTVLLQVASMGSDTVQCYYDVTDYASELRLLKSVIAPNTGILASSNIDYLLE